MNKIIFLSGIHGVGKTTICKQIKQLLNINYYSASQIINEIKNEYQPINKKIKEINSNQDALLLGLKKIESMDKPIILDGHFCLFDSEQFVKKIPEKTFRDINPFSIILLIDEIEHVYLRIQERDQNTISLSSLRELQNNEIEYAKEISDKLNINLYIHDVSHEITNLVEYIKKIEC